MSVPSQLFPPCPAFTSSSITTSLSSKVYIITGASSGIGLELAKILYSHDATVYIAARSASNIAAAKKTIIAAGGGGRVEEVVVDLSDLKSIKTAARQFKASESRLDGLVLNAGVMAPPKGSVSKQGHELQMGTNCLGGYLLMKCLEDVLISTSNMVGPGNVRVVWVSSLLQTAVKGGIIWDEDKDEPKLLGGSMENYMMSKVGCVFLSQDTAARLGGEGVVSVGVVFKGPEYGAYSELFGLLSPDVTMEKNGAFIIPWGRFWTLPEHLQAASRDKGVDGGTGVARRFVRWVERETSKYQ